MIQKKVGLALSGGAAKGFAHIGVIQELEALGVEISAIAGTSIGAVIGGWYAATKDIEGIAALAKSREWGFSWKDLAPARTAGLINTAKIERFMRARLGNAEIERLPIPFVAVAVDIATGDEMWLEKGDLIKAMLASSAVPALFPPVRIGDKLLADGGLVNPLPLNVLRRMQTDAVIAVDLFRDIADGRNLFREPDGWRPWHFFTILHNALGIMQQQLAKIHVREGDIVLVPRVSHVAAHHFHRAEEAIRAGREEVRVMKRQILEAAGIPPHPETFGEKLTEFLLQKNN